MVFAVGFALGTIRTLWIVPTVGGRAAELMEAPVMLAIIILCSRYVARRFSGTASGLIAVGVMSACAVIALDAVVGVVLRQMTLRDIFMDRDFVTGTVYYLLIGVFAAAPCLFDKLVQQPHQ